jgi:hypothetical protein
MANPVLNFAGGQVPFPTPTVPALRESAFEWLGQASIHFDAGVTEAEDGDINVAIEQLQFAETKVATARMRLCEARNLLRKLGQ